jgi:hypothetical protein
MKLNLDPFKLGTIAALLMALSPTAFAQATNRANPRDFTVFKLITERNIFDVNRRPVVRFQQRTNTVVYSFSLVGTMNYEKGLYAVFDGTSQDYHKVLESGGKIATYTVSEITHDSCKLTYGTNQIELRVGMQMRRNTDGSWTAAEQAGESSYAFNSNSRLGNSGRFNRGDRSDRGDRSSRFGNGFSGRNNYRTGDRSFGNSGSESNMGGPPGGGMDSGGAPPATGGSTDPNDVVARLMALRAAQMGQGQGQNDGGNQPPDQNVQGENSNDNQNGNQNVPNQNQPNENQGGPPTGTGNNSNQNQNGTETSTPRT